MQLLTTLERCYACSDLPNALLHSNESCRWRNRGRRELDEPVVAGEHASAINSSSWLSARFFREWLVLSDDNCREGKQTLAVVQENARRQGQLRVQTGP